MDKRFDINLRSRVIVALYEGLSHITTSGFEIVVESVQNLEAYNAALDYRDKRQSASLPYPHLDSVPSSMTETLHFKPPYFLRIEQQVVENGRTLTYETVIDEEHFSYKKPNKTAEVSPLDLDDTKRFKQCEGELERGLNANLATRYLLLRSYIDSQALLQHTKFIVNSAGSTLNRPCYFICATPKCSAFIPLYTHEAFSLGEYQSIVVDSESGILLERQVFIGNELAERETVVKFSVAT